MDLVVLDGTEVPFALRALHGVVGSNGTITDAERPRSDPGMRERAAALGHRIRAEDGVGRAVALIERHLRA